jgi:hypothetical protein
MLEGLGKQAVPHGTDPLETAMFRLITSVPQALMASAQIESAGNQVVVTASHEIDAELVQLLLKVIENAQTVAKQQSDLDDLKQLGLALHNYHDVHQHFPPAVVVDEESGV